MHFTGPTNDTVHWLETITKFHNDVREVAILMCEELGIDPRENVGISPFDTRRFTPYELGAGLALPDTARGTLSSDGVKLIAVARWEMFRHDASIALASWRAVHKHALMS